MTAVQNWNTCSVFAWKICPDSRIHISCGMTAVQTCSTSSVFAWKICLNSRLHIGFRMTAVQGWNPSGAQLIRCSACCGFNVQLFSIDLRLTVAWHISPSFFLHRMCCSLDCPARRFFHVGWKGLDISICFLGIIFRCILIIVMLLGLALVLALCS